MKLGKKAYFHMFWVVFFGVVFATSLGLEFEAGLIPALVSAICLVLSGINLIKEIRTEARGEEGAPRTEGGLAPAACAPGTKVAPKEALRRFGAISCWLMGFATGTYVFGHLIAIPVFTFLFLKARKEGWALSATYAVLLSAGVYLAIVVGVKTPLYTGLLPSLLGD